MTQRKGIEFYSRLVGPITASVFAEIQLEEREFTQGDKVKPIDGSDLRIGDGPFTVNSIIEVAKERRPSVGHAQLLTLRAQIRGHDMAFDEVLHQWVLPQNLQKESTFSGAGFQKISP